MARAEARKVTPRRTGLGRPAGLKRRLVLALLGWSRGSDRQPERDRFFAAAFAGAHDPALALTPEGVVTAWNLAAERLLGFTSAEVLGRHEKLIVPEDRLAECDTIQRRLRAGEPVVDLETVRRARDGRRVGVALTLSPVRGRDGSIIGATEVLRGVGVRDADAARFRLAVEASPAAMLMTDERGVIRLANGEAEAIFGYAAEELIGQPVELLLPVPMRGAHAISRGAFQAAPGKRMMGAGRDLYARRKDGSTFPVEIGLNPLRTPEGLVVLSAIVDTTERKRTELALRLAKQEAERASAMKTQFLANMSHELRTPLNAIIGYSDLMLAEVAGPIRPARYADYLEDIKRGGSHLLSLINDLLDLSCAESGLVSLDEVELDLVALAEAAVKLMDGDAQLRGLSLSLAAETNSLPLRGDERMVTQILLNLLSNALKFTPKGGSVRVGVNRTGEGEPRLVVKDDGVGMPRSQIPRAFAAFVQVENAYRRAGNAGAGLGLALTKRFVELHGGRISLDSAENQGTEVTVVFPGGRCLPARQARRAAAGWSDRRSSGRG
jgi:protein-histidine pros-kinase